MSNSLFQQLILASTLLCVGCTKTTPNNSQQAPNSQPTPQPSPPLHDAASNTSTGDATTDASTQATTPTTRQISAQSTGQGALPPIQEIVSTVRADTWRGTGTLQITVPENSGEVSGSLDFPSFSLRLRGYRHENHIRATLDEVVNAPPTESSDNRFRGTIDLEVQNNTVRGTWEASAQAGLKRRSGTIQQ